MAPPLRLVRPPRADADAAIDAMAGGMAGGGDGRAYLPLFGPYLAGLGIEHVAVAGLDRRGALASFVDDPGKRWRHDGLTRAVRAAIAPGTVCAIIIAHNHPSGSAEPSRTDWETTGRIAALCRLAGVTLLDHLVIGAGATTSMAAMGWRAPIAACQQPACCL